jgi:aspartyl/glutamyl-tRNA(Asn/Gln) amidotransferase C subunit
MITQAEIEKLALLCRIDLTTAEKEKFATEMSSILAYVEKLREVDVSKIEADSDAGGNLRPDAVLGMSLEKQKELIKQAPESTDNLIKTKPVF